MRRYFSALILCGLSGCLNPNLEVISAATRAGLTFDIVRGKSYEHVVYISQPSATDRLYVFIEGDGIPWRGGGTQASNDPTPRHALALSLAAQSPGSVLYLGRPCYFQARRDVACDIQVWTSQRYSKKVVDSMAAVINQFLQTHYFRRVVLIGYSGGGALAVLIAPQVPTSEVFTIAANLDIDAWTRWHRYTPLEGSLNPAAGPLLDEHIREWHLVGDRDRVAPPSLGRRYLDRVIPDHVWHYANFDHVCCWEQQWPAIFARITAAIRADDEP